MTILRLTEEEWNASRPAGLAEAITELATIRERCIRDAHMGDVGTTADMVSTLIHVATRHSLVQDRLFDLRDYFAGQALCGLAGEGHTKEVAAESAYRLADAMLKAREVKP